MLLVWASGSGGSGGGGPGVRLTFTTDVMIVANVDTLVTWDAETWDEASYHDLVTNPSRITIPVGGNGKYSVFGADDWSITDVRGFRWIDLWVNGAFVQRLKSTPPASEATAITPFYTEVSLSATDYLELHVRHNHHAPILLRGTNNGGVTHWGVRKVA